MAMKSTDSVAFRGFATDSFAFFRRLARNNRKEWFGANRPSYEEHVVVPLRALFSALSPVVLGLSPDFEVSGRTGRNFSRINRDIRFARDKSPYHHNLYLFFTRAAVAQWDARLYVGLSADGVTAGFATYHRPGGSMDRLLKPRRAEDPKAVDRLLARLGRRYEIYWHGTEKGEWMKYGGPPRSEPDWKRCRALVVRKLFPPSRAELRTPRFARTAGGIFRQLFPLYALSALDDARGEALIAAPQRQDRRSAQARLSSSPRLRPPSPA